MFCFICKKSGNVTQFTGQTLNKCLSVLAYRKDKGFKYGDLILTGENSSDHGYHYGCYRKFSVLKRKNQEELEALFPSNASPNKSASIEEPGPAERKIPGTPTAQRDKDNLLARGNDVAPGEIVENANPEPSTSKSAPGYLENEPGIPETTTTSIPAALKTTNPSTSLSASSSTAMEIEESTQDSSDFAKEKKNSNLPCIFCSAKVKTIGHKRVYPIISSSESTRDNMQMYATGLQDEKILACLQSRETISYHKTCYSTFRKNFSSAIKKIENPQRSGIWHDTREIHKAAFKSISELIEEEIIEKGKVYFVKDLYATYRSLLTELGDGVYSSENTDNSNTSHFCDKILQSFGDRIIIEASNTPLRKRIVYKLDLDISESVQEQALRETADATRLEQAAFEIRNSVKNMPVNKLPCEVKVEDILKGECEIPELLFEFICNLVHGPNYRRQNSDSDYTKIKSLCSDIVYSITKGRAKPSKQLPPGI